MEPEFYCELTELLTRWHELGAARAGSRPIPTQMEPMTVTCWVWKSPLMT